MRPGRDGMEVVELRDETGATVGRSLELPVRKIAPEIPMTARPRARQASPERRIVQPECSGFGSARRRRSCQPIKPKPRSMVNQVAGSGTAEGGWTNGTVEGFCGGPKIC